MDSWEFEEPSDTEDSDLSMDSDIDALASIRGEPHKPSGARWRSRAVNDDEPDTGAAATLASRRAPVPSSTSRRANHDYAVAELLRKSTVLVRGKAGAAAAAPISSTHELYTNPGARPAWHPFPPSLRRGLRDCHARARAPRA